MWERAESMPKEAREFARAHGLTVHVDLLAPLPASGPHPLPERRTHGVAGEWRGRHVQRFFAADSTVELMTLPSELPGLQVVPAGLSAGAMTLPGVAVATGDAGFDAAFTVVADDVAFARAFLTPAVREALAHPAAAGRVLTVAGGMIFTHAAGHAPWSEARVRFEFLAVVVGRADAAVWRAYDRVGRDLVDAWTPAPAAAAGAEGPQFAVAAMPAAETDEDRLNNTGEFEVAALAAELDGTTFMPHASAETAEPQWRYAPVVR